MSGRVSSLRLVIVTSNWTFAKPEAASCQLTYLSQEDPDLSADVDELNDYGVNTRLTLRKGRLSKYDIDEVRESLEQIYCRIVDEIGMPIAPPLLEAQRSVSDRLYSSEIEF